MSRVSSFDEKKIISGCLKGDRRSQWELYEHFSGKMYAVCLRYTSDAEFARDCLQDGFIKVFTNLEKYQGTGAFEGWIRRIFVNTIFEELRKNDVLKNSADVHEMVALSEDSASAIDQIAEGDLLKVIQELPPGYRAVFNLFAIEGYSHKEVGEMLDITESTSRSQYVRARQMLQTRLKELGY